MTGGKGGLTEGLSLTPDELRELMPYAAPAVPAGGAKAGAAALSRVAGSFGFGYQSALLEQHPRALAARLARVDADQLGFAFEGAGMALALLEANGRPGLIAGLVAGPGKPHRTTVYVGVGVAHARIRRPLAQSQEHLSRELATLVADGYGFHQGLFRPRRYVDGRQMEPGLGAASTDFDRGLGRALWFLAGADARQAAGLAGGFDANRQPALWKGIGFASTYAGGSRAEELEWLASCAGDHLRTAAEGAAWAASVRELAGNPAPYSAEAYEVWTAAARAAARPTP